MKTQSDRWFRKFPVPACLLVSLLVSVPGEAANYTLIPSLSLDETWDSNIFNTATDETSDYIFRARPALTLSIEAFQTTAKVTGGFEFERYRDNDQLNRTAATKNFDLTLAEPFQITPRFFVKPSANFVETSDTVRRIELTQDSTRDLPAPETVVTARSKQRAYSAGLQITYLVTPSVDVNLGGSGMVRDFVEPVAGTTEEDSRTITGETSVFVRMTPRFSPGIFFTTSHNSFDVSPNSRSYTGGGTARYLLSPNHTLTLRAGASYFEQDADQSGQTFEKWLPYGSLTLTYTWRKLEAALGGSYQVSGVGSFGQATKRGNVDLILTYSFAEKWLGDLFASFQTNDSLNNQNTVNITTIYTSAGIRYTATQWATFRLSGNIVRQSSDGIEGNDVDRESVLLGVVLSKPYRFSKLF